MKTNFIPLFFLATSVFAQKNELNLGFGFGPSHFVNQKPYEGLIDNTRLLELNMVIGGNRSILFNPGMTYYVNTYKGRIEQQGLAIVGQRMFGFNTDMLLKLSRSGYLRVGLFLNTMNYSVLEIQYNGQNGYVYSNSSKQIYENYSSNNFQAGFLTGYCWPFQVKGYRFRFNVNLAQNASPVVLYDYYANNSIGQKVKVLSARALPTRLLFLLDISLKRKTASKQKEK